MDLFKSIALFGGDRLCGVLRRIPGSLGWYWYLAICRGDSFILTNTP